MSNKVIRTRNEVCSKTSYTIWWSFMLSLWTVKTDWSAFISAHNANLLATHTHDLHYSYNIYSLLWAAQVLEGPSSITSCALTPSSLSCPITALDAGRRTGFAAYWVNVALTEESSASIDHIYHQHWLAIDIRGTESPLKDLLQRSRPCYREHVGSSSSFWTNVHHFHRFNWRMSPVAAHGSDWWSYLCLLASCQF